MRYSEHIKKLRKVERNKIIGPENSWEKAMWEIWG
jgi:hypothetical protein